MMTFLRRCLGALVLALAVLPLFRLLDGRPTGPWGNATIRQAETSLAVAGWGIAIALGVGVVVALLAGNRFPGRDAGGWLDAWSRWGGRWFPLICGGLAAALAALVSGVLLEGQLTNIDEMAMLVHARFWAAGLAGGVVDGGAGHWLIPNTLLVDGQWLSQYPPGQVGLLTVGVWLGRPLLVGAILAGVVAACSAATFARLLPDRPGLVRLMGVALALSPMLAVFGGGLMSHTSALAFTSVALYGAVRAREGQGWWALLSGAAVGVAVVSRPWSGLLLGVVPLLVWAWAPSRGVPWFVRRVGAWVAGGVPLAVLFGWYNLRTFGGIATLGYEVSYGAAHSLGFHVDPWGYAYGPLEAVGYTSADLAAFGLQAMESPIPVTLLAGLYLLLVRRLDAAGRVLMAWALLPVLGASLYWFHQPRMLFEGLPGFLGLACLGALWLIDHLRGRMRAGAIAALTTSLLLGLLLFTPQRLARYQWSEEALTRIRPPALPSETPALVFVHTSWNERLAGRLQAVGMRPDSLNPVLRRNDTCDVQRYLQARRTAPGSERAIDLDTRFLPGSPMPSNGWPPDPTSRSCGCRGVRGRRLASVKSERIGSVPSRWLRCCGKENCQVLKPTMVPFLYAIWDPKKTPRCSGAIRGGPRSSSPHSLRASRPCWSLTPRA